MEENRESNDATDIPAPRAATEDASDPVKIAAQLLLARLFDRHQGLRMAIRSERPVVIIDVPQAEWIPTVAKAWPKIVFDQEPRLVSLEGWSPSVGCDAVNLVEETSPAKKDRQKRRHAILRALTLPIPFVAISPAGVTHLPQCLLRAATNQLVFPPLDPIVILQTVRILTGRRYRDLVDPDLASRLDATDLIIAARYIPSPERFIAELRRLGTSKNSKRESRDIALSDLHGLGEARDWAQAAIADIAAWKHGEIAWSAVSSAIALEGPPGTGKTQFAKSFAAEVKFDLIVASYAKWQSSKEGHLGNTLRAMIDDFEAARAQAPSVLFIDEIDSFPDRSRLTHAYRSYTIDVVNALLEQLDGLAGRDGVIVIGASNDLSRCDPALLRAGRFDTIARIGLPDLNALEAILRVRLGDDLQSTSIRAIAELTLGMTGADIESLVNDARRTARRENRPLTLQDLRHALISNDERPPELHWRICVHEAAHILVDVIHLGPEDVFASVFSINDRGGISRRTKLTRGDGTYETYRKHLEIILAGRVGEEILTGAASDGAGSSTGSDLDRATRLAADMIGSLGLLGPNHLTYFGSSGSVAEFLRYGEVRQAIARELSEADKTCRMLLEKNRAALRAVADHLFKTGRVDGGQVQAFLEHHSGGRQLKLHLTVST